MNDGYSGRAEREITHGKLLATADTETIWGWGTPAGRRRAKRRANLVSTAARLGPGVRALEVGCGTGVFTELFAQAGATIVAVDISPELLEKAKVRGISADRVQFLCKRFEEYDLQGQFDAVIGSSVLHHLEIRPAFAAIYRLLKPGGIMAFAEPNRLNPQVFAERTFLRRWLTYVSPDETAFVRWSLQGLLRQIGFDEIRIFPFDWLHPLTPEALIRLMSSMGCLMEKIPGLKEFAGSLLIRCRRPVQAR